MNQPLPINFEVQESTELNEIEAVLTIANILIDRVKNEGKKRIRTVLQSIPHEPNIKEIVRELEEYDHKLIVEAFIAIEGILKENEIDPRQPSELELLYDATFKSILAQTTAMYLERCISTNLRKNMDRQ